MKKALNGFGYNKPKAKLIYKSKAENIEEVKLQARKNTTVKSIIIGSAALSFIALGFLAVNKYKNKKKKFF